MTFENSIVTIKNFLSSEHCSGEFNLDQLLGLITATLSCSEYIPEIEIAELVIGDFEQGLNNSLENDNLQKAIIVVANQIGEQLALKTFDLEKLYPLAEEAIAPTAALSHWCEGYLQGYLLTEEIWFEDFDFLGSDPDFVQFQAVIEDCEATLDLIATFANWQYALTESDSKELLGKSLFSIYLAIIQGVEIRHQFALMLEHEKLEYQEFDDEELSDAEEAEFLSQVESFIRDTPKIGRNDPCFCGSGKKYKKCCLN